MINNYQLFSFVNHLTIHFFHHKTINYSILEQICRLQILGASKNQQTIQADLKLISQGFSLLINNKRFKNQQSLRSQFFDLVNILVFNVSAMNEHNISEISDQLIESTSQKQNGYRSQSKFFNKDVTQKNEQNELVIQTLRQNVRHWIGMLSLSQFLKQILQQNQSSFHNQSFLNLIQTLDYLFVKYQIQNQVSQKIVQILAKNSSSSKKSEIQTDFVLNCNKLLFTQSQQDQLYGIFELASNINYKNIISIINANYLHQSPPRKIFNYSDLSGKKTIEIFIQKLIKRVNKTQLFAEKLEQYAPFRIFLYQIMDKHSAVYFQFNELIQKMAQNGQTYSYQNSDYLKEIQKFLTIQIPINFPAFHSFLLYLCSNLTKKYSKASAIDLIKKLIFNRLFLNPNFYVIYFQPNQSQIKKYVSIANDIRVLFYQGKCEQVAKSTKNSHIAKIGQQLRRALDHMVSIQTSQLQGTVSLYINDKIIKRKMLLLNEQIKNISNQHFNVHNLNSDYSLSFSFLKNDGTKNMINNVNLGSNQNMQNLSEVKPFHSNRSAAIKDNNSIRFMVDQLKQLKSQSQICISPQKNQGQSPQKKPQKNFQVNVAQSSIPHPQNHLHVSKTANLNNLNEGSNRKPDQQTFAESNVISQRQILSQLVDLRREYGQRKRQIRQRQQKKAKRRQGVFRQLKAKTQTFKQYKKQIQLTNDLVHLHIQIS